MKAFFLLLLISFGVHAESLSIYLESVPLSDYVRLVYGEILKRPFVMSSEFLDQHKPVTVSLRDLNIKSIEAETVKLIAAHGFDVVTQGGVVSFAKPLAKEDEILIYRPKHRSARYLADIVQPLTGAKSLLGRTLPNQASPVPVAPSETGAHSVKPQTKPVHVGDQSPTSVAGMTDRSEVDQIAFTVRPGDSRRVLKLLADLDTPVGEVLLRAAVYEVGTGAQKGSAIQMLLSLGGIEASAGGILNGDLSVKLKIGGLDGLITALDRDNRFKSLSRPHVRVRNGAQAKFSVGQDVPIIGTQQIDRNGNPLSSVEYKPSGVILTARPEIREEVIELEISQELSSFVATSTGVNNSPTLTKRSVATRLGLQSGEVVILAGLQDEKNEAQRTKLPFIDYFLHDGTQTQQSEIIVIIEAVRI